MKSQEHNLISTCRIIKKTDAQEALRAFGVLDEAKMNAESITAEAQKKANTLIENANKTAKNIIDQAIQEANTQKNDIIEHEKVQAQKNAAKEVLALISTVQANVKNCDKHILNLVHQSIEKILGHFDKSELLAQVIQQGIKELCGQYNLKLRIHPIDEECARSALDGLKISQGTNPIGHLEVTTSIEPGRCYLVGDGGLLDISLASQVDHIIDGLEFARRRNGLK